MLLGLRDIPKECTCNGVRSIMVDGHSVKCKCWYDDRYARINDEYKKRLPLRYRGLEYEFLAPEEFKGVLKDEGCVVNEDNAPVLVDMLNYPEKYLHGRGIFIAGGTTKVKIGLALLIARRTVMVGAMKYTYFDWKEYFPDKFFEHWKENGEELYAEIKEAETLIINNFTFEGLDYKKIPNLNTFWDKRSAHFKLTIFCGNYVPRASDVGEEFMKDIVADWCDTIILEDK